MPAFNKSTKAEKLTLLVLAIIFIAGFVWLYVNEGYFNNKKSDINNSELLETKTYQ